MSNEKGIDLSAFEDAQAIESDNSKIVIEKDGTEPIELNFEAVYHYHDNLIRDVASKILGEQDIEVIKEHLRFLYDKANENTIIEDIQDRIEFFQWKKDVENGVFDDYWDDEDFEYENEDDYEDD